jgi:predicted nucleic acid-binding protein
MIVQTVAEEVTSFPTHRDAKVVQQLLDKQRITSKPVPVTPVDGLIDSYNKVDDGERDTLRLALTTPHSYLILDDVAAFITAAHFGLTPVMLLDLLALWAKTGLLDKMSTLKILAAIGSRYSEAFVKHTKHKLNEV